MSDPHDVKATLRSLKIETPSWAYGNSGTRFKVFAQPGVPRDPYEKIADAATVQRGACVCDCVDGPGGISGVSKSGVRLRKSSSFLRRASSSL